MSCALILFGWFAYRALPVSELPNVDYPTIVVSANLPGADPETMASAVTTPLEKQLSTIASIDSMSSISSAGQTRITLQFSLNRDIDAAAQDVQTALTRATRSLPQQMPNPPTYRKVNPTASPILYLAMTSSHLPLTVLDDYAETYITQRLSMLPGVAEVNVFGSQQYAVRIRINPNSLINKSLDFNSVAQMLQGISTNQPAGILQTHSYYHLLKVDGQLNNAKEFNNATLTTVQGAPIHLKDIGYAIDSVANDKVATWFNNQRAIVLAIQRQPGANTVAVSQAVLNILPELTKELPGNAKLSVVYDRSQFIKASLNDVKCTLIAASFLVILVIYFFLNNLTSTLITVLALPISVIASFGIMYLCNYNIDNLSLMGFVLAIGFIIDDAVVVLENITRHFENGLDRLTATLKGTEEISFTILSMTLSLVAVFIPILFMGSIIGRLFHEFAVVVGTAIVFSGIVALTLTPMLCSQFLSHNKNESWLVTKFLGYFNKSKDLYLKGLNWSLDHDNFILFGIVAILFLSFILFYLVPKGFIPSEDTNLIMGTTQVQEGLNFNDFTKRQQKAADIIGHNTNVASFTSTVGQGSGAAASPTTGQFLILLKPLSERKLSADQILQQLRQKLTQVAGIKIYLQNPLAINIGGIASANNYQFVLQSLSWSALQKIAQPIQQKMAQIPGIQDVNSDLNIRNPEIRLHILREKAAQLGITAQQIETTLYAAYGGTQVNSILTPTNEYQVILEADPKFQEQPDVLNTFYIKSTSGILVPLSAITQINESVGPLSVNHYGQLPAVTLSFSLAPGTSLGTVTTEINTIAKNILPNDVTTHFAGAAQTFQNAMQDLPLLLLITILVIYMVLAILYEHFWHPITILTALPFATFGALLVLLICHQELDIFSFIGIIMLVGLVKKNGIMMVDFALEIKNRHALPAREAIYKACEIRYRPIMMTTLAAILATLPIALGLGTGGEARRSLGIAVVGGLLFSQTFTLFVTPVFFLKLEKVTQKKLTR